MTAGPRPRGRRPGKQDTRAAILTTARVAFAERGYDGTSVRQVAAAAGVDSALVHHYFTTKDQLFQAAVGFPLDIPATLAGVTDGPVEELGRRLTDTFVRAWEHPASGPALEALLRRALTNRVAGRLVREFFAVGIVRAVKPRLAGVVPLHEVPARADFVASQLFGLAVVRHLLRFEPVASTPRQAVVAAVAPTVQRYLTGQIEGLPDLLTGEGRRG